MWTKFKSIYIKIDLKIISLILLKFFNYLKINKLRKYKKLII